MKYWKCLWNSKRKKNSKEISLQNKEKKPISVGYSARVNTHLKSSSSNKMINSQESVTLLKTHYQCYTGQRHSKTQENSYLNLIHNINWYWHHKLLEILSYNIKFNIDRQCLIQIGKRNVINFVNNSFNNCV